MRLPFQIKKTYSTPFSQQEILHFVQNRLNGNTRQSYFSSGNYMGSIKENRFKLKKKRFSKNSPSYPQIKGSIIADKPTEITIKITPSYLVMLFFLVFPLIFLPVAIFSDEIRINGVLREPKLYERFLIGFLALLPLILGYFKVIRPIKQTEAWIKKKLLLEESRL